MAVSAGANGNGSDVIVTEKPATGAVLVCVEGQKKYLANIGQFKGSRALKIMRSIRPTDRV